MSELTHISTLVKNCVLESLTNGYSYMAPYGRVNKAVFINSGEAIIVKIEVDGNEIFDSSFATIDLMESLRLIAGVSAFILRYK